MPFAVLLTEDAIRDLQAILDHVERCDGAHRARHVRSKLKETAACLADFPHRGVHPRELLTLGIRDFREVFFKPYRIVYRVVGSAVYVVLIVDGRRDVQIVLERRLFQV